MTFAVLLNTLDIYYLLMIIKFFRNVFPATDGTLLKSDTFRSRLVYCWMKIYMDKLRVITFTRKIN
jgi:hypothetical protein